MSLWTPQVSSLLANWSSEVRSNRTESNWAQAEGATCRKVCKFIACAKCTTRSVLHNATATVDNRPRKLRPSPPIEGAHARPSGHSRAQSSVQAYNQMPIDHPSSWEQTGCLHPLGCSLSSSNRSLSTLTTTMTTTTTTTMITNHESIDNYRVALEFQWLEALAGIVANPASRGGDLFADLSSSSSFFDYGWGRFFVVTQRGSHDASSCR